MLSIIVSLRYYCTGNGELRCAPLSYLSSGGLDAHVKARSSTSIGTPIIALYGIVSRRTQESFIIGGADDGSVVIWSLKYEHALALR